MKTEMNTVKVRKTEELEAEQLGAHIGEIVRLHGSIYKIRKMSSFAFVLLRTKRQMVQVCIGGIKRRSVCPVYRGGDP